MFVGACIRLLFDTADDHALHIIIVITFTSLLYQ